MKKMLMIISSIVFVSGLAVAQTEAPVETATAPADAPGMAQPEAAPAAPKGVKSTKKNHGKKGHGKKKHKKSKM